MPSDDWSDDEENAAGNCDAHKQIVHLRAQLQRAKQDLADFRRLVQAKLDITSVFDDTPAAPATRDDDTHYFESYAQNGAAPFHHSGTAA